MKTCSKCKQMKEMSCFNQDLRAKSGVQSACKACRLFFRKKNIDKTSIYYKQYYQNNKLEIINYNLQYNKNRLTTDPLFKFIHSIRTLTKAAIKKSYGKKYNTTIELLGCSGIFAKQYLEYKFQPGMTWDNHGKWHIDHIRPCASFDLKDPEQQKVCFHYTNLQPLWAKDNLSKGTRYES